MNRTKEIIARNPEGIPKAIGLTGADSKAWQVQYAMLKQL